MGRHSPELSRSRRLAAAGLGGGTMLMLIAGVWFIGGADPPAPEAAAAAASTTSTSRPTTSSTTTSTTTSTTVPSTTAVPETTTTTIPTTTTTTLAPLVLEPDGLDVIDLGADVDEVVAEISARLGGASSDSGWVDSQGNFGTCPGNIVRVIRWDSLRAFFSDGPTDFGEDTRHFFYYSQSAVETETIIELRTAEGIGMGSTVADLKAEYGSRVRIESTGPFGVIFSIDSGGDGLLSGTLTESVDEGRVTSIAGGFGCGA